ncbi:CBS domain-containing protein [Actinomycetospora lutea]|uniref:CBS domain-containing protein n=1 Tax=Actinomycetospora lutea TaxID=663604 RepID=UPI00236555B9|nr:CBS domain-containing protein [Actinomycetospora lutea]MDD7939526.1 CBS domain-containing protein [Actinomycetospora lutea]
MNPDPGPYRARDLMTSPVLTTPPDAPRSAVAALLVSHGIASAPVVDAAGRLLGLVDELHLVGADDEAPAAELMTRPVPVADPDTPLDTIVERLLDAGTRALPVVVEDVPVGIVSRRDVLRRVARGELVPAPRTSPQTVADDELTGPIVVGVDGSDGSVRAVRWAAAAARLTGAGLVALTAAGVPDLYGTEGELEGDAARQLAATLRRALPAGDGGTITEEVRAGRPLPVLVEASERARLLVVGSRQVEGLGGPRRGSLTARLVGYARCPVVVVPEHVEVPAAPADERTAVPVP